MMASFCSYLATGWQFGGQRLRISLDCGSEIDCKNISTETNLSSVQKLTWNDEGRLDYPRVYRIQLHHTDHCLPSMCLPRCEFEVLAMMDQRSNRLEEGVTWKMWPYSAFGANWYNCGLDFHSRPIVDCPYYLPDQTWESPRSNA